ncbi:cellulase-like family protein [Microbacterium sp. 77mftsu3.1]|uniref:cellulase-like family protein n=1 Tax=Microbacterium sp. 77mftsu3.1 TaxID=1761802 RepID=UPI00037FC781|nr:cellulase-like family protein [Microbacterium sp. 77mftsu3.1]SDG64784.1 Sugar-binding cellulase-like [Microbacterium sp. 77mftsu3.1]
MTDRYLGSGNLPQNPYGPTGPVPAHLPDRLAITLWDFSWYTRAGEGDVYADLDAACADAASLGYNAIRICAAPLLLFGDLGLDDLSRDLTIEGLGAAASGGYYGQRTRWYDTPGGYAIDVRAHLATLLTAARRHGLVLILSSWEYQQSCAFAASPRWFEAVEAVPLEDRYRVLAEAWDRMLAWIDEQGARDLIALVEIHNEVDFSILPAVTDGGATALEGLQQRHPDLIVTASIGKPPHLAMHQLPATLSATQCHVYSYGVLDALQKRIDIRSEGSGDFPNADLGALLRADAPTPAEYGRPAEWKLRATVVTDQMIYGYDWVDAAAWDAWLDTEYPRYAEVMHREIESRVIAIAEWARWQGVPALIGEGWVGYTPLHGGFEESETGRELAEHGIRTALDRGVWGVVLCSNAAPHHPMWQLREWQQRVNALVRAR